MSTPPSSTPSRWHPGVLAAVMAGVVLVSALGIWFWQRQGAEPEAPGLTPAASPTTSSPPPGGTSEPAPSASSTPSPSRPSAPLEPGPTMPGWREVRAADGWRYRVPDDPAWRSARDVLAYVDGRGQVLVRATQPSYLNSGSCADPGSIARTSVGWAEPSAGSTSEAVATRWAAAVAQRDDGSYAPTSGVRTRRIRAVSGLEIEHSSAVVDNLLQGRRGCLPRQVEVNATSYGGPGGQRILVMVRDLGVSGTLPSAQKEQLLRLVRHTP